MALLHPSRAASTSLALVLALVGGAGCSSDAGDVFGETSGAGPSTGPGGGSGDGGAASTGTEVTSSSTGDTTTTSTGDGGASTTGNTSTSTGDGGGPTTATSTGEGPTSTAAGPTCGDGAINGDELCDGDDLGDATCASVGVPGNGELLCVDCAFDTSQCVKCGNGDIDPGEDCDDGGVAADDGCGTNCHFEGLTCQAAIAITVDVDAPVTIATTNEGGPAAPGTCLDATGAGRIIRVTPETSGFLTAWIRRDGTTFDTSLRMGYQCGQETLLCADSYGNNQNAQPPGGEVGSLRVQEGSPVFVHVDAWGADDVGDFTVEIALSRGRCDDPVVVPVEPGSEAGIVLLGLNAGTGNDEQGDCGFQNGAGNGEEVTYELVEVGAASPVDVEITPLEGFLYNPVLHARRGACDERDDEVLCSAQAGFGSPEAIDALSIDGGAFVHADAAQGSTGGYRMNVIPPAP